VTVDFSTVVNCGPNNNNKGKTMKRQTVSVETFVNVVMRNLSNGGNQTSVARELGVTPAAVCLRLKYLRQNGSNIPKTKAELKGRRKKAAIVAAANKEMKRWK
jgi:predicted transcriptional regulator